MRANPSTHSSAQPSALSPVAPLLPGTGASSNTDQGPLSMIPGPERQGRAKNESVRPRSAQTLTLAQNKGTAVDAGGPPAGKGSAISDLFICSPDLIPLLTGSVVRSPQLVDDIGYLCGNNVKINLSHRDSAALQAEVHELLAEAPTTLKCVLSDENHRERPSLYVRERGGDQPHEIVYASGPKDLIPLDDLAFAVNYISKWQKNNQAWPAVYAYFQPPKEVPPELISGIDEMPISRLSKRGDVCDLSGAGFRPYHGEKAPSTLTARIITVKVAQGDNKPVANAIETQTRPGDVVLVDGGGHAASVTLGGITASLAEKVRGIKGILIYGEVRDQVELKSSSIPVFGLGCSSNGPSKVGPGAVHCSLDIGNIPFKSGDIIKIDRDQIVVVPSENAESILSARELKDEGPAAQEALPTRGSARPMPPRKTFESMEKPPSKNRPRPETPSFIPQLFKEFTPAQICDTASFIKSERLWGAGTDMALRMGTIPEGVTLAGEAVLANGSEEGIVSALSKAKRGDFLVVSGGSEVPLTAAVMEKIHAAGISCMVIDARATIDEGLRKQYDIPCFAREGAAAEGSIPGRSKSESGPPGRIELNDGFLIKPGYVMMADIDGIAAFSPTKFSMLYRAGSKKSMQEKTAEERNKSGHPHPLPAGSIVTDRYYEPFVHAHIDQFPFLRASRGWAKMQLPAEPTEVQVGNGVRKTKLGPGETLEGIPEKITAHGEDPMTFTLRNKKGDLHEVEGVSGRALFEVALAAERKEAIEVRSDGSVVKQ